MTETREFLNLKHEIDMSDFKLKLLSDHGDKIDKELEKNDSLKDKLNHLQKNMSVGNPVGDHIRLGFLHIIERYQAKLRWFENLPSCFPDLGQGMIIPGYLLSLVVLDIRTALETEGNYNPVSNLIPTNQEWDVNVFSRLIDEFCQNLKNSSFDNKIQAFEWYQNLLSSINTLHTEMMNKGIIGPYR